MKTKILLIASLLLYTFSCKEESHSPTFAERVVRIKEAAELNGYLLKESIFYENGSILIPSRENILNSIENGYQSKYGLLGNDLKGKLFSLTLLTSGEIKAKLNPTMSKYFEQTLDIFSKENFIKHVSIPDNKGGRSELTFESLVAYGQQKILIIEDFITNDPYLNDDEKIAMLSSTSHLYYMLPTMVDAAAGSTGSYSGPIPRIGGKVASWDWLKKTINVIATIVVNMVEGIFSPVTLGVAAVTGAFGPGGWAVAGAVGAFYGFAQGFQCIQQASSTYTSCYTCVFTVTDPNDPCH